MVDGVLYAFCHSEVNRIVSGNTRDYNLVSLASSNELFVLTLSGNVCLIDSLWPFSPLHHRPSSPFKVRDPHW